MIDTTAIKDRISCLEYCQRMGIKLDRNNRGVSPLRPNAKNKMSFSVSDAFFYDFGDGTGGDVIDLCAMLEFGGDRGQAINKLASLTGVDNDHTYDKWVSYTQDLCGKIEKWHRALRPEDIEYLHSRKITDETIARLKIGYNGRLVIPYWKNKYVCYYITRAIPGGPHENTKYMKAKIDGLNENIPFGMHTLNRGNDLLVIAEGTFDVLSFEQEGYSVLGTLGGHFNKEQLKTVRSVCKQFKRVFLCFDNDSAGNSFTNSLARFLFKCKIDFVVGKLPRRYKDVSEYYEAGENLQDLIVQAEQGVNMLCENFTETEDFAQFAYQVSRRLGRADLAMFFSHATNKLPFDAEWMREIKKACMSAPSQQVIADEVVAQYALKYHAKMGFLQYNGRFWELIPDERVQSYVRDSLGRYATGSALSNIAKIIKTMVLTEELFNQNPLMNFVNGTLELEPEIKFREHREEDNCTHCLDYSYNPAKRDEKWEKFIESVTDGNEKKMKVLQEIAGYPLISTNQLIQKAVCLIGDGSNGKSVYIETLEKIYGEANRSSISINDMRDSFKVILLMNSWLNISTETKGDVSGVEDTFKQIVDGSTVTACYKGKDNISFKPRCKMIMSCNDFAKAKDTSGGWLRRWLFVKFPLSFVEEPKRPYERKIDKTLLPHFTQPDVQSAIFNWCLEGYKILRKAKKFTEPEDTLEIKEEYRETIDPLIIFVKSYQLPHPTYSISNDDFYRAYTAWCAESNHHVMSKNSFLKRVANLINEYRPDIERFRTATIRGYQKAGYIVEYKQEVLPWE